MNSQHNPTSPTPILDYLTAARQQRDRRHTACPWCGEQRPCLCHNERGDARIARFIPLYLSTRPGGHAA